jgi:hypothetical protein
VKTVEIKVSSRDVPCGLNCFVVSGLSKHRKKWVKQHELYEADINAMKRIVTPVTILGDKEKHIYMMDVITGSLYDLVSGRCLTSSQLIMDDFVFKKNLDEKLLKMKAKNL